MKTLQKSRSRFLVVCLLACLLLCSSVFALGLPNARALEVQGKNVLLAAESGSYTLESKTLARIGTSGTTAVSRTSALLVGTDTFNPSNADGKTALNSAKTGAISEQKGFIFRFHTSITGANACNSTIVYSNPIYLKEVESITLRLYLRMSGGDVFTSQDGENHGADVIFLFGYGDTGFDGTKQTGYVVPNTTTQHTWTDLTISGDDLIKLATKTEDGYLLKGLQVGFRSNSNGKGTNLYTGTESQCNAFMLLDYITYEVNEAVAHQKEVTKNGSTLLASANQTTQVVPNAATKVGSTAVESGKKTAFTPEPSTGSVNESVWKHNFHSWAVTNTPGIEFSKSVKVSDVESIVIRMNAHLSAGSEYSVAEGNGVMITSLEQTNIQKGATAHLVSKTVTQDAWIDYKISGNQLDFLTDGSGNINGIQIASQMYCSDGNLFHQGSGSQNKSWILIDYVYYVPKYQAAFEYEGAAINELATYTTAEKVTLPAFTQNTDEVFVGWKLVDGTNTYLYKAGEQVALTKNVTFSAITVDFDMIKGASIRVAESADDAGIRFACTIDAIDYAALGDFAIEFGTLILPTESLDGKEFIVDNFDLDPAAKQILVIEGTNYDTDTIEGAILYTGVMSKVNPANYARAFSARGYIKINYTNGAGYIYTDYNAENNSRSISEVAKKVKESSVYASYTDGQKAVIDAYADAE